MLRISAAPSYLDEREFSFKSFFQFLKDNKNLTAISAIALLFVYGVRLSNVCFGIDTELHMALNRYINWMELGRFGLVGLQKLWTNFLPGKELFNPYLAVFLACVFLLAGTLLWCHFIDLFSNGRIKKAAYIPFAVLFISHQVWVEQIYFVLQAAECLFIVFLSPIAVYCLFDGARMGNLKKTLAGLFLTFFCISVYQGALTLILCGLFAAFVLFYENSNSSEKNYSVLCARLALLVFASVALYFGANKLVKILFNVKENDYYSPQIGIGKVSFLDTLENFARYIFELMFAHSPLVGMILAKCAGTGWRAVERLRESCSCLMSNIAYAPVLVMYLVMILRSKKKSFLYVAAAVMVPLSVLILPVIACGRVSLRAQYAMPFAFAFAFLYVASSLANYKFIVAMFVFALCGAKQCLVSGMLNYSDVIRYQADARLCDEIAVKIKETDAPDDTPVFIYGVRHPAFLSHFIKGECCGDSSFEFIKFSNGLMHHPTLRVVAFMRTQGYNFTPVDESDEALVQKACAAAENMPDFPYPDSVKNLGDVVVVKLSELTWPH